MMDPKTAVWLSGRIEPNRDRDAVQLADLRDADANGSSRYRSTAERVQAFFSRAQAPSSANCDCTAA
jgi:hypothetical protein